LEEWTKEMNAHLHAYAQNSGGIRIRIREIVRMNIRAVRR
jgi:hypothetical protein